MILSGTSAECARGDCKNCQGDKKLISGEAGSFICRCACHNEPRQGEFLPVGYDDEEGEDYSDDVDIQSARDWGARLPERL